jgi:hypothetical protein
VTSTERFIALLVGIIAILTGISGMLVFLARISYKLGQLVQRFGDHVLSADRIHGDQETRLRNVENRTRRLR